MGKTDFNKFIEYNKFILGASQKGRAICYILLLSIAYQTTKIPQSSKDAATIAGADHHDNTILITNNQYIDIVLCN